MSSQKSLTLAGLDIETLSLDENAVVFQVGVAVDKFTAPSSFPIPENELEIYKPTIYSFGLDILEQINRGRTISQDTINFHHGVAKKFKIDIVNCREDREAYYHQDNVLSVESLADQLRDIFQGVDEIWVNHLDFDLPRLRGALRVTAADPLFHFRKPRDVVTARKSGLRLPDIPNENRDRHDASLDASWNLHVALAWHHRVAQLNYLEDQLVSACRNPASSGLSTPPTVVATS